MTGKKHINIDQRIHFKRDRRCAVVILGAIAAMLTAVVIWLLLLSDALPAETRGRPVYWLLMIPLAFWANQLAAYTPWTLRWLRAAQVCAPVLAGLGICAAGWANSPVLVVNLVLFGICLLATIIGALAMRGSLLDVPRVGSAK